MSFSCFIAQHFFRVVSVSSHLMNHFLPSYLTREKDGKRVKRDQLILFFCFPIFGDIFSMCLLSHWLWLWKLIEFGATAKLGFFLRNLRNAMLEINGLLFGESALWGYYDWKSLIPNFLRLLLEKPWKQPAAPL